MRLVSDREAELAIRERKYQERKLYIVVIIAAVLIAWAGWKAQFAWHRWMHSYDTQLQTQGER